MASELERVSDPDYLRDLADQSLDELRRKRQECQNLENALSYARRILHGRLDIVRSELEARRSGAASSDLGAIIERLPRLLSEGSRSDALPRPPQDLTQGSYAEQLIDELDERFPADTLASLPERSTDQLGALGDDLREHEQQISAGRQQLHDIIDELHAEIIRRYQAGTADVDSLLT